MDARSTINVGGMSDHIILIREINKAAIQASILKHANTELSSFFTTRAI